MNDELKRRFDDILNTVPMWGIDRDFINLNDIAGPALPEWIRGRTLYEVYVRAFSTEGTLRKVTERLPRIRNLGIDVIWLMPVYPIGEEERKGSAGSPYAVQDFYRVNPELGSAVDLMNLIKKAHDLGIRVILDFVPNHVAPDYQYLRKQPHLVVRNKEGNPTRKIAEWTDIVDLDYTNADTCSHVSEIMQYWIREFDVDGYRCDVAGLVPMSFWEMVIPHLKAIKPDLFMLAEWEAPGLHKEAFHSTYDWSFYSIMLQVHENKAPARIISDWLDIKISSYPKNAAPLRFIENHDKPRAVSIFKGRSIIPYLTLLYTVDGIPLVYNGQETGASVNTDLFEKEPIDWKHHNLGMYKLMRILIALRKKYHALSSKNYTFTQHNREDDVLAYVKLGREKIFTIINFRDKHTEVTLPSLIYSRIKTGRVLFNTKNHFQLGLNKITLMPYQAILILIR